MIEFACPDCDRSSRVIDAFAGEHGKCPGCFAVVRAPDPDDPPDPADAGPPRWGVDARRVEPLPPLPPETGPPCPACGEPLKRGAKKCRFCGVFLSGGRPSWATGWATEQLATLRQRLFALLIDAVIYGVVFGLAAVLVEIVPDLRGRDAGRHAIAIGCLFAVGVHVVQSVLLTRTGASIGMTANAIKAVRQDGLRADFGALVAMRGWVYGFLWLFTLGTFVLAPILLLCEAVLLISPAHRTLRDQISGTVVIREHVA